MHRPTLAIRPTLSAVLALTLLAPLAHSQQRPARPAAEPRLTTAQRFESASFTWEGGQFDSALVQFQRVLLEPSGAEYHDRIAELTGEIYRTVEVAKDARSPLWSSDGRHLAYEMGAANTRSFRIVRAEQGFPEAIAGAGHTPSFSPDGRYVIWQGISTSAPTFHWLALGTGSPQQAAVDAGAITGVTLFGRSPLRVAVIAGTAGDSTARLMVRDLTGTDGTWRQIAIDGRQPVGIVRSPDGSRVLVLLGARGAFARVPPGTPRATSFAELGENRLGAATSGMSPTFSRDGSTIAWVEATSAAGSTTYRAQRADVAAATVATVTRPAQSLAVSPDGRTIAFSQMLREDWEVFTASSDGSGEPKRITREIQHDLFPQFLSNGRLLAVMGEARHRRSFSYDLDAGARTRLFHNNTVRTVAPEYEWAPSPDGTRVAIVAERDGDTVTPHRHLYLMDLGAKIASQVLTTRLAEMLAGEQALRLAGNQMFSRIADSVRTAVNEVSVARIYDNQRALFAFDSKHVTQPGNWPATEWLLERYRSYGLDAHLQRFNTNVGRDIEVANVVAVVKGTLNPELIYVVGAHFDSRAEGPGADDNTSGTAMILEAARVIARRPLPATVMFVSFTGEEAGLRGAREFGRRMKDSIHVVGALNNDMMGWSNDFRMDNTIRYSNAGLRDVQHAAAMQFTRLITFDAYYYKSTDAHALFDAWGDIVGGIGSYPILGNPHYHQPHDVLETINHQQLGETSKTTIATIMLMASSPSRLTGVIAQGNIITWNAAVESRVSAYLVRFGPPEDPMKNSMTVTSPRAVLNGAQPGWQVAVKAVNAAGMQGWDWARATVR